MVPDGWTLVRLGDILEEQNLRARDTPDGEALPILSLTKKWGLIPQEQRFEQRIARSDVSDYKVVQPGWIAYNPMVIWEGAIHGLLSKEPGLVSPVYAIWKAQGADWLFLHYMFHTPLLLNEFLRLASGVVKRRRVVRKEQFLSIEVPLPSLAEQKVISKALRASEQTIDQSVQVVQAILSLKRATIENFFSGLLLEAEDGGDTKEVELVSLMASTPKNGLYKPLSEYGSDGVPIVRMTDFPTEGAILETAEHRIRASDKEIQKYQLEEGDIVVNRVNSVQHLGKAALMESLNGVVLFESNTMRVRVDKSQALPEFIFRFLSSRRGRRQLIARAKRAVAQASINQRDLGSVRLFVPDLQRQRELCTRVSAIEGKLHAEMARIDALEELFKSLLRELMSGKLRVEPYPQVV